MTDLIRLALGGIKVLCAMYGTLELSDKELVSRRPPRGV